MASSTRLSKTESTKAAKILKRQSVGVFESAQRQAVVKLQVLDLPRDSTASSVVSLVYFLQQVV